MDANNFLPVVDEKMAEMLLAQQSWDNLLQIVDGHRDQLSTVATVVAPFAFCEPFQLLTLFFQQAAFFAGIQAIFVQTVMYPGTGASGRLERASVIIFVVGMTIDILCAWSSLVAVQFLTSRRITMHHGSLQQQRGGEALQLHEPLLLMCSIMLSAPQLARASTIQDIQQNLPLDALEVSCARVRLMPFVLMTLGAIFLFVSFGLICFLSFSRLSVSWVLVVLIVTLVIGVVVDEFDVWRRGRDGNDSSARQTGS